MIVVALAGNAGVGKNTVADLYFKPLGFADVSFAEDIKIRAIATGVASYDEVFADRKTAEIRTWLQEEGTERGRHVYGEDMWPRSLFARLRRMEEAWGLNKFVITDARFVNELRFVQSHGGLVYHIHAPQRYLNNGMTDAQRAHASEQEARNPPRALLNGVILNDPEHINSVRWQVETHLYRAGLLRGLPAPFSADPGLQITLLERMLPSGVVRAAG